MYLKNAKILCGKNVTAKASFIFMPRPQSVEGHIVLPLFQEKISVYLVIKS